MKLKLLTALTALALTAAPGCVNKVSLPAASPPPSQPHATEIEGALYAGIGRADITPPPGASTFGHGPDARVADGYWTRLYCRAFYFEVQGGERVAIIPCDLPAMSTLLQRRVAEIALRAHKLPASRIMLTATHTHAGPGHYFDGTAYGGFGSSRLPGFDDDMVSFLAERIGTAIDQAVKSRRPAKLAWSHRESLWGLTRNRNLNPHRHNRGAFPYKPSSDTRPLSEQERAIDPRLDVLRVEDAEGRSLGALSFFAMHPTVLPSQNRLFGADTHGIISRAIEREMRRGAAVADPLHGVINTNEGDITPVFSRGTFDEVVSIGSRVAGKVWEAFSAPEVEQRLTAQSAPARIALDVRYLEVDLPGAPLRDKVGMPPGLSLCDRASTGLGMPSGSREHSTWMGATVPEEFYEGNRDPDNRSCQGPKREIGGVLQRLLTSASGYPERVPLALVRLDDTWIAFSPAEMTVMAGKQVTDAILAKVEPAQSSAGRAIIGGLANGYIQYVTTAPEYDLQYYEGASNLYGRLTASLFADRFELLAASMAGGDVRKALTQIEQNSPVKPIPRIDEVTAYEVGIGPERERFDDGTSELPLASIRAARAPIGLCRIEGHDTSPALCFWWADGGPGQVAVRGGRGPYVRLVSEDRNDPKHTTRPIKLFGPSFLGLSPSVADPAATIDDTGIDFMTRVHAEGPDGVWYWSTLFRPRREEWDEIVKRTDQILLRIEARAQDAQSVLSCPFSEPKGVPLCTIEAQEYCGLRE